MTFTKKSLGKLGIWTFQLDMQPMKEAQRAAAAIEELGFGGVAESREQRLQGVGVPLDRLCGLLGLSRKSAGRRSRRHWSLCIGPKRHRFLIRNIRHVCGWPMMNC